MNSDGFKEIFQVLCNNSNIGDTKCSNDVLDMKDSKGDTIFVIKDHHFYEGIQKYDMYFAGWYDAVDSVEVVEKPNSDIFRTRWYRQNIFSCCSSFINAVGKKS